MQQLEETGYERLTTLYQAQPRRISELVKRELARRTLSIDEFLIALDLPYELEPWQIDQIHTAANPNTDECVIVRARGGSKTFDMMVVLLYYAYIGFDAIFWCSQASQMKQPKKYLSFLCGRTFLKYALVKNGLLKEECTFKNLGTLFIGNLTEDNARSPRADILYFDEEARADKDAYDASDGETSVSKLAKIIHGSTPVKGSIFDDNKRRMIKEGLPVLERSWHEIGFMNKRKIAKAKKKYPGWYFRQEYECSFESPQGACFTNLVEGDWNELLAKQLINYNQHYTHFGVDWNPAAGHYICGSRWLDDFSGVILQYEENLGTDMHTVLNRIIAILELNPNSFLEMEDGGTNMGYCDAFWMELDKLRHSNKPLYMSISKRVGRRAWDGQGINKMKSITLLLPITIYYNEDVTPETSKWIEIAHWDKGESGFPKLEKDPDQHPLDAFLHSEWCGRYSI